MDWLMIGWKFFCVLAYVLKKWKMDVLIWSFYRQFAFITLFSFQMQLEDANIPC